MSEDTAGSRTPEEAALAAEIEHTRERLGETVEALAAKADVKGRAQHRAAEVAGSLRGKARAAMDKVAEQAADLRDETVAKAAQAKGAAQSASAPVAGQVAERAAGAGHAAGDMVPAPVQRSAGQAAALVRGHRGKAAAAAAAGLILAWLAVRHRRR
jgi:phage-related tail protein